VGSGGTNAAISETSPKYSDKKQNQHASPEHLVHHGSGKNCRLSGAIGTGVHHAPQGAGFALRSVADITAIIANSGIIPMRPFSLMASQAVRFFIPRAKIAFWMRGDPNRRQPA
jgi:hypothetical protein